MEIKYQIDRRNRKLIFHYPSELEKQTQDLFAALGECDFVEREIKSSERRTITPLSEAFRDVLKAMRSFERRLQNSVLSSVLMPYIIIEKQSFELLKTKELAYRDELTGALNRRAYHHLGEKLIALCSTLSIPLSVIVYDIDDFKSFNSLYGHPGGDYTLTELTKVISDTIRGSDGLFRMGSEGYDDTTGANGNICRIGGDEFFIYLFGTTAEQALSAIERVYKAIREHDFSSEKNPIPIRIPISISAGIATLKEDGNTLEELYKIADTRAGIAKQRGKNQFYSPLLDKLVGS